MILYGLNDIAGSGFKKDIKEGLNHIKQAADKGSTDAIILYSEFTQNKVESLRYLKNAANNGNYEVCLKLIQIYEGIDLVDFEQREYVKYVKMSADFGPIKAKHKYGIFLYTGKYIEQNKKEGIRYIKEATDNGIIDAMLDYGNIIMNDSEFLKEKNDSALYFKKANNS